MFSCQRLFATVLCSRHSSAIRKGALKNYISILIICNYSIRKCVVSVRRYLYNIGFQVFRPDSPVVQTCARQASWGWRITRRVECPPGIIGRIVRVISDQKATLELFEVKVYGIYGKINKKHVYIIFVCM